MSKTYDETPRSKTEYTILASMETGAWKRVDTIKASSAAQAIRNYVASEAGAGIGVPDIKGTYVAVPLRSWNPVTVREQTQTKMVFSFDEGEEAADEAAV